MTRGLQVSCTDESEAYREFCRRYPEYELTSDLDDAREKDFSTLHHSGLVYVDHTGSALYGDSQVRRYFAALSTGVYGNPHSRNEPSRRATENLESARTAVLNHLNADPDEYRVIFTANATAALKLVGESFPFQQGSRFVFLADNHNSVLGMRTFALRAEAEAIAIPLSNEELRADSELLKATLDSTPTRPSLFAYPGQSNFSGVRHPLDWIDFARERGWTVAVDAAALVPTSTVDLHEHRPDFLAISFYKMFGWPTGIGCLVARTEALARLRRPWFAGGTVLAASARQPWHVLAPDAEAFEDGTPNFLSTLAIPIGLEYLRGLGLQTIGTRLRCLTGWLLSELGRLRHENGTPICTIYGPANTEERGATIAMNFIDRSGHLIDERIIEERAIAQQIALRTGCFCNPGVGETVFGITRDKIAGIEARQLGDVDSYLQALGLPTGGAIRISFGHVSNFGDAWRVLRFARSWCDWVPDRDSSTLPPRTHC